VAHPSSAGVMASTLRPKWCQYQAVELMAKTVAPMGRALFFRRIAAPSAEALDVDAARCGPKSAIAPIHPSRPPYNPARPAKGADARGGWRPGNGVWGRTEAVLLEALRAAAPAERAVRSADRANMLV
jgi:hypothetical protein